MYEYELQAKLLKEGPFLGFRVKGCYIGNYFNPLYFGFRIWAFKEGYIGDFIGTTIRLIEGYTRSLDHGSYQKCLWGFSTLTLAFEIWWGSSFLDLIFRR